MIVYFSGTGNSQYVAQALADRLHDKVVCANVLIKKGKKARFRCRKPLVLVFPVYVSSIAKVFVDFLKSCDYHGVRDAYFVATCASKAGAVANVAQALCQQMGLAYKGACMIQMPQNYVALFSMTPEEEIERRMTLAIEQADQISQVIAQGGELDLKPVSAGEFAATKAVEKMYYGSFTKTKKFYVTEACIGCGLCERRCPMNRITMEEDKPVWEGSCIHCMSCINRCPMHAIEYGKKSIGKTRYICQCYESERS